MSGNHLKKPCMVKERKGNIEYEWEKAEKIHIIESIMLDMLIIYKFIVQSGHNHFYNVRNNIC